MPKALPPEREGRTMNNRSGGGGGGGGGHRILAAVPATSSGSEAEDVIGIPRRHHHHHHHHRHQPRLVHPSSPPPSKRRLVYGLAVMVVVVMVNIPFKNDSKKYQFNNFSWGRGSGIHNLSFFSFKNSLTSLKKYSLKRYKYIINRRNINQSSSILSIILVH
jgi:hypothetical protein